MKKIKIISMILTLSAIFSANVFAMDVNSSNNSKTDDMKPNEQTIDLEKNNNDEAKNTNSINEKLNKNKESKNKQKFTNKELKKQQIINKAKRKNNIKKQKNEKSYDEEVKTIKTERNLSFNDENIINEFAVDEEKNNNKSVTYDDNKKNNTINFEENLKKILDNQPKNLQDQDQDIAKDLQDKNIIQDQDIIKDLQDKDIFVDITNLYYNFQKENYNIKNLENFKVVDILNKKFIELSSPDSDTIYYVNPNNVKNRKIEDYAYDMKAWKRNIYFKFQYINIHGKNFLAVTLKDQQKKSTYFFDLEYEKMQSKSITNKKLNELINMLLLANQEIEVNPKNHKLITCNGVPFFSTKFVNVTEKYDEKDIGKKDMRKVTVLYEMPFFFCNQRKYNKAKEVVKSINSLPISFPKIIKDNNLTKEIAFLYDLDDNIIVKQISGFDLSNYKRYLQYIIMLPKGTKLKEEGKDSNYDHFIPDEVKKNGTIFENLKKSEKDIVWNEKTFDEDDIYDFANTKQGDFDRILKKMDIYNKRKIYNIIAKNDGDVFKIENYLKESDDKCDINSALEKAIPFNYAKNSKVKNILTKLDNDHLLVITTPQNVNKIVSLKDYVTILSDKFSDQFSPANFKILNSLQKNKKNQNNILFSENSKQIINKNLLRKLILQPQKTDFLDKKDQEDSLTFPYNEDLKKYDPDKKYKYLYVDGNYNRLRNEYKYMKNFKNVKFKIREYYDYIVHLSIDDFEKLKKDEYIIDLIDFDKNLIFIRSITKYDETDDIFMESYYLAPINSTFEDLLDSCNDDNIVARVIYDKEKLVADKYTYPTCLIRSDKNTVKPSLSVEYSENLKLKDLPVDENANNMQISEYDIENGELASFNEEFY